MRFRTFRESIRNMDGEWTGNDAYFAQTQSQYTAACLPEYQEKSKTDSTISWSPEESENAMYIARSTLTRQT